jgi:hypothetical protein
MGFFSLKNRLIAVPLKYGLIGGGVAVLLFIIFYLLDLNPLVNIRLIDMVILGIFIFFTLKEFRDMYNNGTLHFWQGMTGGVVNYLTIAIISSIFILVMTVIIDPEMTTNYIEGRILLLQENKQTLIDTMDEDTYKEALAGVEKTTGFDLALDDFLKKSVIGLFLTIIIAIILRK